MSEPTPQIDRIEDLQIESELQDSYLTYAMSTIMDRALPDVRDGLKPSQRRILVAMNDLKLGPRSKHYKCAKICGDTSGNYHPARRSNRLPPRSFASARIGTCGPPSSTPKETSAAPTATRRPRRGTPKPA